MSRICPGGLLLPSPCITPKNPFLQRWTTCFILPLSACSLYLSKEANKENRWQPKETKIDGSPSKRKRVVICKQLFPASIQRQQHCLRSMPSAEPIIPEVLHAGKRKLAWLKIFQEVNLDIRSLSRERSDWLKLQPLIQRLQLRSLCANYTSRKQPWLR